jgi:hypothetical protein
MRMAARLGKDGVLAGRQTTKRGTQAPFSLNLGLLGARCLRTAGWGLCLRTAGGGICACG